MHRNFYSDEAAEVSCIAFVRRLCADLSSILERQVEVSGDEAKVPTTKIQPIGLLVNELVTNAAKHGSGKIEVSFNVIGQVGELRVCDEGDGLPADFDPDTGSGGLGMKVVAALATQLGGRLVAGKKSNGMGSCFSISFPTS